MKTSSLIETFSTATYQSTFTGTGNVGVLSNQLKIDAILGGANYSFLTSNATYDLTDSYCIIEVASAGDQALTSLEVYPIQLTLDSDNSIFWLISGNFSRAYKKVATVSTQIGAGVAYTATAHRYFRIRESAGIIYWDYSADRVTWTNAETETVANLFAITALQINILTGVYASELSSTSALFDNLNVTQKGISPTFTKNIRPAIFTPGRAR